MTRNAFGVWQIQLPSIEGQPAIKHGSRVKLSLITAKGEVVDRVPAWIRRAEQDTKSGLFEGIFWNPPNKYHAKHARPQHTGTLKIYESHVGIASPEETISTYKYFTNNMIPYIADCGYNAIQLMAIMEHPYYASFGYQVTSFFAPSSRFGTPEDLQELIDTAHGHGLVVLLDVVHSHASKNVLDGLNMFDGTDSHYFHGGPQGQHSLWDSRLFNYGNRETLRFLLSNLRYWMDEFGFDGFRFDGVTSMLYKHHGIAYGFTGDYREYYEGDLVDGDALVYLQLANLLCHMKSENIITIAEDVSGMPLTCRPISACGLGFDYRLAMSIPDMWIKEMKSGLPDEHSFHPAKMAWELCNRRYMEPVVAYTECHDQALVGDKTLAFWLMDSEMYTGMSKLSPPSLVIDRGMALHKLIRLVTYAMGGEAYLTFMGNEFGHPEWLDFPRQGNGNSFKYARRQFNLVQDHLLRYQELGNFDKAMLSLPICLKTAGYGFVSLKHELDRVLVFERGNLVFIFNWHPTTSLQDYRIGVPLIGEYKLILDSDWKEFGGFERVERGQVYHVEQGVEWCNRPHSIRVYLPCRSALVLEHIL